MKSFSRTRAFLLKSAILDSKLEIPEYVLSPCGLRGLNDIGNGSVLKLTLISLPS
jgi:hypothetical protein